MQKVENRKFRVSNLAMDSYQEPCLVVIAKSIRPGYLSNSQIFLYTSYW